MRRLAAALGSVVLVVVMAGLMAGSASAAGPKKLIEGTVYDTTCAAACTPECPPPPHCGPITQDQRANVICAQRAAGLIVCPLYRSGVSIYPVYSGEGATVKLRRRGSATVIATLPVVEGHFKVALGAGQYVFHPYLPEEPCWSGTPWQVKVFSKEQGPIPLQLLVSNNCVAHPGVR